MIQRPYLLACLSSILFVFFACTQSNDGKRFVGTASDPNTDKAQIDTTKFNTEYIDYRAVKINGVLPLDSKYDKFLEVLGQPDSVVNFNPDTDCQFFEEPYQYIYLQGGMFYLQNDTAMFQYIDFNERPDLELKTPAITLNGRTTLQEVQKLYPKAVGKIRRIEDPASLHLRLVDIGAGAPIEDAWWILFFDGEKLVQVELFSPC